jgi:hypothetical protein
MYVRDATRGHNARDQHTTQEDDIHNWNTVIKTANISIVDQNSKSIKIGYFHMINGDFYVLGRHKNTEIQI